MKNKLSIIIIHLHSLLLNACSQPIQKGWFSEINYLKLEGIQEISETSPKLFPRYRIVDSTSRIKKLIIKYTEKDDDKLVFFKGKKHWYSLEKDPEATEEHDDYRLYILEDSRELSFSFTKLDNQNILLWSITRGTSDSIEYIKFRPIKMKLFGEHNYPDLEQMLRFHKIWIHQKSKIILLNNTTVKKTILIENKETNTTILSKSECFDVTKINHSKNTWWTLVGFYTIYYPCECQ